MRFHRTVFIPKVIVELACRDNRQDSEPKLPGFENPNAQAGARVELPEHENGVPVIYEFGCPPPSDCGSKAFDLDHLRALCVICALPNGRLQGPDDSPLTDRYTFATLFRGGDCTPNTRAKLRIKEVLDELRNIHCKQTLRSKPKKGSEPIEDSTKFTMLENFHEHESKQGTRILRRSWTKLRVDSMLLEAFYDLRHQVVPIHIPSFLSLRSDLTAKIYLYALGPAWHATALKPFKITTATLWDRLDLATTSSRAQSNGPDKNARYASRRAQILTQNGDTSVLAHLNRCLLGRGERRLRANIERTESGLDYLLFLWSEETTVSRADLLGGMGKLKTAWLSSGGTEATYLSRLRPLPRLSEHELELLTAARIEVQNCTAALRIAKALLSPDEWKDRIGEAKSDRLENEFRDRDQQTRNPTGLLLHRLEEAVRSSTAFKPRSQPASELSLG